jgi:Domain of unknown function (DUF3418)
MRQLLRIAADRARPARFWANAAMWPLTGPYAAVHAVEAGYADLVAALPVARTAADDRRAIGWVLAEWRVSLWAHQPGTPRPVSEQRIYRAIDAVRP